MNNKDVNLKEKLKQALTSTAKVISDDFKINNNLDQNKDSKKFDFFDLEDAILLITQLPLLQY